MKQLLTCITAFVFLFCSPILNAHPHHEKSKQHQDIDTTSNEWLVTKSESSFNLTDVNVLEYGKTIQSGSANFLKKKLNIKGENDELELIELTHSPQGSHLLFAQKYRELHIFGTSIKINLDSDGNITSLFHKIIETTDVDIIEKTDSYSVPDILSQMNLNIKETIPLWFVKSQKTFVQAYRSIIYATDSYEHMEVISKADGSLLYIKDLNEYSRETTDVNAMVFMPNPISSADTVYVYPYVHDQNHNHPALNAERFQVGMQVYEADSASGDTLLLIGPHVEIRYLAGPETDVTYTLDSNFYFSRSTTAFNDVNAYYHIHNYREWLISLGFDSLVNYRIHVDAHGLQTDNSLFNFSQFPPRILFGVGGVPDAEDADVIIHEYGHAISHSAAPGTNNGTERNALEEGLCDYIACSYARYLHPNRWEDLMNWDGHNEFWNGRWCTTEKVYPEDMTGSIYGDGQIIAGTLMNIWGDLGREVTDRLVFTAMYSLASNMRMTDFAHLLIQADSLLYGEQHKNVLINHLAPRGLFTNSGFDDFDKAKNDLKHLIKIYDHDFSFNRASSFEIEVGKNAALKLYFYRIDGRLLMTETLSAKERTEIITGDLNSGVYLLLIRSESGNLYTEKIIRY